MPDVSIPYVLNETSDKIEPWGTSTFKYDFCLLALQTDTPCDLFHKSVSSNVKDAPLSSVQYNFYTGIMAKGMKRLAHIEKLV